MTTFHNSIFSTNDTADDLKRVSSFAPKIKVAILTNEQPNESHLSTATIVKALRQRGIELVSPVDDDYTHFPESEEGTLEAVQKGATDILWMNNKLNDEHPIARLSKSQTLPNEVTIWGVDVSSQKAIDNESYIHKWLNSESQYQPNLIRRLSLESDGETVVESDESESYSFSSKASSEEVITTHVLLSEPEPEPEPTVPLTISQQLAKQVCSLRYEDLPSEAIQNTKILILDTVGCALAGSKEPVVETLLSTPGFATPGSTPLIGRSEKLDPLCAALINGVSAHALDFDDVNVAMGGHAAAPILPTLFSLASTHPCSGKDLITAFIAGFEVETKLAKVVNDYMYVKGFHPTSVLGVFGSTAAACSLLRLSEHETSMALGLAASMASGIKANFGSMSKSFHIGAACKDGLSAALLASKGFTSSIDAFESSQGFFNVYNNGEGNYDLSVFDKDDKKSVKNELLHIVEAGAGIKLYPCCDSTHCSIDSILTLKSEHNFNQDDISSIEIQMNPKRLKHVNKPVLKNSLDCKFSVQYNISRAIIDSEILLSSFSEDKYQDERVLNLMDKVTTMEHTELWKNVKGNYLTTIKVELKDGRVLAKEMVRPKGRSREDPASHSSIKSKFFGCSSVALNEEEASDLYEKSMSFEHLETLDSYLKNFSL